MLSQLSETVSVFLIKQVEGGCQEAGLVAPQRRGAGGSQPRAQPGPVGVGGVGGAEDEVGAIAAEERLDGGEGLHQVGAVIVSVVEHDHQVSEIIKILSYDIKHEKYVLACL